MPGYAQVIVDVRVRRVDRCFCYSIPKKLKNHLRPGHQVLVPFNNRQVIGYVIALADQAEVPGVKPILRICTQDPVLTSEMLTLAQWMADYYGCLLVDALQCFIPPGMRHLGQTSGHRYLKTFEIKVAGEELRQAKEMVRRAPRQQEVLSYFEKTCLSQRCEGNCPCEKVTLSFLRQKGLSYHALRALEDKGYLASGQIVLYRDPLAEVTKQGSSTPLALTPDQQRVFEQIKDQIRRQTGGVYLLHGVTGSGKTEVYMQLIDEVRSHDQSVILLVPEISMTPQMLGLFKSRFADDVAVLHSRLSDGERFDEWQRIASGEAGIVIGARSAVFAPVRNLGLLILDEEHETTYKQAEGQPPYHTRDVAIKRAELNRAVVLLGSATPSLESYYMAEQKVYNLVTLPRRINNLPLPQVDIIDMREELKAKNRSMFSRTLQQGIRTALARREQVILFINRRGTLGFILCRECGHVLHCENCAVSLTYHEDINRLCCHYCGLEREIPTTCPECGSRSLRGFGAGTQRVERQLANLFPQARIARMDGDTTRRKGAFGRILGDFRNHDLDVLIGTQMVAKGLDFPQVTLVGVMAADLTLNIPDYRAAERTFQLLTQVAGRAGRGTRPGRVIVQTYNPEHYSIKAAQHHDYVGFYKQEIAFRSKVNYPPVANLVRLVFSAEDEEAVVKAAKEHLIAMQQGQDYHNQAVGVLGPVPCPLSRLQGRYRWQIMVKGPELATLRKAALIDRIRKVAPDVAVFVDINPVSMY
ncbi:MAG: primosomal protein N' [Limnochordia bacterium]|nr:primosomal protein N' [Limnochordia bacterium]MDD2629897.1 primosomal protein N' [Limnochordia bacterium]MDD4517318.1 primosomal protein N' [Limnochordia bacterium]